MTKRNHFISQLAHVEIYTPNLEETVRFYTETIGLLESERQGKSVYLRAWGEFFHHSLKITEAPEKGLGHIGWRAQSEDDLLEAVRFIEAMGCGEGWIEGDLGHGRAYRFRSPDGHLEEIFWEVEKIIVPKDLKSRWRSRPHKQPGHGFSTRRLDHVTLWTSDVKRHREFYQKLGFKHNEMILLDEPVSTEVGGLLAVTSLSHEVALFSLPPNHPNESNLNHVCYAVENREQVLDAADFIKEHGYHLEMRPSKHAVAEAFYLYAIDPGGNRLEIYSGSPLYFAPDYGPIEWRVSENPNDAWSNENILVGNMPR
ncbi:VOC family protein [Sporosarcina sp. ACRSM]|uniref:VOC family protein n=1 Tax=Sporosarcina sp. ACRSM TaxID=2918216 RepID=UPI001EF6F72D|nr:VOC family protein [Sporosarcina sp. ACRSM]MCG7337216.1 VOC family protein [Sporosarcina sp. ACRSM]